MIRKRPQKKLIFLLIIGIFIAIIFFWLRKDKTILDFFNTTKVISINDNGLIFETKTSTNSISDLFKEKNITLGEEDQVIPDIEARIIPRSKIEINRAVSISIEVDGRTIEDTTLAKNVAETLTENGITLSHLDLISPSLSHPLNQDLEIIVTRINIEQKVEEEKIDFKTVAKKDDKLGWREKKIEQEGEKGIKEVKYEITYKNGKEISRKILEKHTTKEPVPQIEVQGTYMKLGKAKRGEASHYASSWGELNASRDIPRGGYAKVTNMDNGKSTVVKINDYGPQSPSRIIDLSYKAFTTIASAGQGIAHNVKVEQILN